MSNNTWELILQERCRILNDTSIKVNAPATLQEIQYLEESLDVDLPHSFKKYLLTFNGQINKHHGDLPLLGYNNFLSIDEIIKTWNMMNELFDDEDRIDWVNENKIKPVIWSRKWIPFTDFEASDRLVIDLEPGKNGRVGQIFCCHSGMDYEGAEFEEIISDSFEDFSKGILSRLKQNMVEVKDSIIKFPDYFIV